jgi:hypothetical protein
MATALSPLKNYLITATVSTLFVFGAYAQDPPSRVADLNYLDGNVSMQPAGADDWSQAVVNRPFTTGDYLWADTDSRAELHLNNAVIRLGSQSSIGFLNLDDRIAQLRFAQGEMILRVRRLGQDESFEVDTPNAAITILRAGEYRFNADSDSATTWVVVRHGQAEVTGGGQAFTLSEGNSAQLTGTDQLSYNVQYAPDPDDFEGWAEDRDSHEGRGQSARYLPPNVIGYEELDNYGTWRETPGYGAVWYPTVDADWAPYHSGHWAWIEPWGWTWVDDSPWGFAPAHYGRWAFFGGTWGWVPGPLALGAGGPSAPPMTAVYAPALVAFIGGGGWGASLSFGSPAVGWVPLGPGEVYAPTYQVSQNYFRTVNTSSTTIVNTVNITNVYNNVYVNKSVANVTVNRKFVNMAAPNAVTAMPQTAFASGRPVKQAGIAVPKNQVAQVQPASMTLAPPVAPVKQALAPAAAGGRVAARPPAKAINMAVVAKVQPPPPPVPFAAKQASYQQNLGRPVNIQAVRQSVAARAAAAAPVVKVAPVARQVTPQVQPTKAAPPASAPNRPGMPANRPPAPVATPAQTQPNRPPQNPPAAQPPAYRPPPAQNPPSNPRPAETTPRQTEPPAAQPPAYRPPQPPPANPRPVETTPHPAEPSPANRPPQNPPANARPAVPPPKPTTKPTTKPKKETEEKKQ